MSGSKYLRNLVVGVALAVGGTTVSFAASFDVPGGDLDAALETYIAQSGVQLLVPNAAVHGVRTQGAKGNLTDGEALARILKGTGFVAKTDSSGVIGIAHEAPHADAELPLQLAQAAPASRVAVETVTVTSSKLGGADVQSIPIAITALSQEQLTATQTAGGPDLVKQVPNLTFTKTNFTGYSIQIRGIGTQAISVSTDPAVAVALNDIPFIRNHFFEQEFYDLDQAEVLRGPQGTLYGRNATAGVVNLITAKPTDQFEAMASGELGNYHQRRFEGMINLPIVDDRLDIRIAGEWTKRQGYSFNDLTDQRIDGRDLWSGRVTIGWKPTSNVQTDLVWEHFSEDDNRLRSGKQLCKTAPDPTEIGGVPVTAELGPPGGTFSPSDFLSQGCETTSLYSPSAFEVPNGFSLPYYSALAGANSIPVRENFDPYASTTQSTNLRDIESTINPVYKAKNDVLEFNVNYTISPALTFTSQTGYNKDFLWSSEDYNRFDTQPGAFQYTPGATSVQNGMISLDPNGLGICSVACSNGQPAGALCKDAVGGCNADGVFCDPQLGCSDRLVAEDLSEEHAWQMSQEFRLSSNFSGPLNFSFGANFLHYETEENYYVFINTLTMYAYTVPQLVTSNFVPWVPGVTDNSRCLGQFGGFSYLSPAQGAELTGAINNCPYIDPNPISSLNGQGHNYFLSQNPYVLNSYAGFGEAYYNASNNVKLTGGLRWTDDQKHFTDIPSELVIAGYGYASGGVVNQQWDQWTGRFAANWTPDLDFTDQTLLYGSYAHGYKAGGANPPGAVLISAATPDHPLTFKPEHIEAFELGTKNTMLDGALTLNGDIFYYNYDDYQISEIVDRSAINLNFSAMVDGAELESTWEPLPGLKFNFAGGYENSRLANGSQAIDLMDRTAGNPNWIVVKPFVTSASNCILPTNVILEELKLNEDVEWTSCSNAYTNNVDPVTDAPYVPNPANGSAGGTSIPPGTYPGFNPATAPNNGEGFDKNISGNQLPNAPPFTVSFGAQYTVPITTDWAGTLRGDYYWQDYSWARVFNDDPYDRLRGYTNVNLTLIFTNQNGWQVMLYDKNVFDTAAITGDFLNSDDSGLTTNVFLTDPKLIGIRVTKNW